MKDVADGDNSYYLIGLRYEGGNILTPGGEILGAIDDFVGNNLREDEGPCVFVRNLNDGGYTLSNGDTRVTYVNVYFVKILLKVRKFASKIYVFLSNVPVSATRCPFNPDDQAR